MTYSKDFVQNVLRLYNNRKKLNLMIKDILIYQNISRFSLYNWINNYENKNTCKRKKRKDIKITPECEKFIVEYVKANKQFQMKKIKLAIRRKFKFSLCNSSIYNILKKNNFTNKRTKENHYPYDNEKLKKQMNDTNNNLKKEDYNVGSTDETALYFYTKGNYGWSLKGNDCEVKGHLKIKKISLAMAITKNKVLGYTLKRGSFKSKSFNKFMMKIDKNNIKIKKLMDNAKIHHAKCLNKKIKESIIFNVPYYSKFNPIEMYFNTLKRYLSQNYICSMSSLRRHIDFFISKTTPLELSNYFSKAFGMLKDSINV